MSARSVSRKYSTLKETSPTMKLLAPTRPYLPNCRTSLVGCKSFVIALQRHRSRRSRLAVEVHALPLHGVGPGLHQRVYRRDILAQHADGDQLHRAEEEDADNERRDSH